MIFCPHTFSGQSDIDDRVAHMGSGASNLATGVAHRLATSAESWLPPVYRRRYYFVRALDLSLRQRTVSAYV